MKITKEWLLENGFKSCEAGSFINIGLPYYVRNAVCLFYNEPFAGSFLAGYGFTHDGNYYASTFYWVEHIDAVVKIYEAVTAKSFTR